MPVIKPDELPTEVILGLELLQEPVPKLNVVSYNVSVDPTQRVPFPVTVPAYGSGFTDSVSVAEAVPQA